MRKAVLLVVVVCAVVLGFGAQCVNRIFPPATGIEGTWLIDGTFSYYADEIATTMDTILEQSNEFTSEGTFTTTGTAQWVGSPAQQSDGAGTYAYDAAAQTLDMTYESFELDGVPQTAPEIPILACVITETTMTLTWPEPQLYSPAEPLVFTRQ